MTVLHAPETATIPVKRALWAMNGDVELFAAHARAEANLDRAERWLAAFERRFSRFDPLSELSRLNAAAGRPFRASPALYCLVDLTLGLARRSGGRFDPTVLPMLDAAGYDRSFETLTPRPIPRPAPGRRFTWRDVRLESRARIILMPEGCGIDLGGIAKGWAVDRMARILGQACLVNGGGDVYAGAPSQPGEPWRIGVADPFTPERDAVVLALQNRGVATASTLKRRWQRDGVIAHHLIDPRTGRPSRTDAVQVTVIAPSATEADYHAKVALLMGIRDGLAYLGAQPDVAGLIFRGDGASFETARFARFQEQA